MQELSRRDLFSHSLLGAGVLAAAPAALQAAAGAGSGPPFRHIHLDFHTSPAITGVGQDFDAEQFAATLKEASINSITVFAKCHHGMSYYPTRVGIRHPNLKTDLLGPMVEACHRSGIQIAAYISTMYDQYAWTHHGDWRVLDADGREMGHRRKVDPLTPELGSICVNTPYTETLVVQAEEVVGLYPVDGMFYDNFGYGPSGCCCATCMLEREKLGLDSARPADRHRHAQMVMDRVMARLAGLTREKRPGARVFINGPLTVRQDPAFLKSSLKYYSHIEIESLPGGSWGYGYYRIASRYLRNLGLAAMGMTGSFHRSWGDFGTIRNQAALDYECFGMLAQANSCAVGDHLHPRGRLNRPVYERIGQTYRSVAEKEPWCRGATAVTEIGSLLTSSGQRAGESDLGVAGMLMELHHQFDIVHPDADFSRYRVLILPDSHRLDESARSKLQHYLDQGGKLILSHESGLDPEGKTFVLPVGVRYEGPWQHEEQYLELLGDMKRGIPDMVHESYEKGSAVKAGAGTAVLARIWNGYFDRDFRHFQVEQTPFAQATDFAGVAATPNVVYIATPIFRTYARQGYAFYRQLVGKAIERFLPQPLVRASVPSAAELTVTSQNGRRILHLLYYTPQRRAPDLDIVEETVPLVNVKAALRLEQRPRQVYLAPQKQALRFDYDGSYAHVVVPAVNGHQMVVFEG